MWKKISTSIIFIILLLIIYHLYIGPHNRSEDESDCGGQRPEENELFLTPALSFTQTLNSMPASYQISSLDGLTISLSNIGEIDAIEVNQTLLPLLATNGGFSFREVLPSDKPFFGPTIYLNGTLKKNSNGTLTQAVVENGIDFSFTYIPKGRCIEIHGEINDLRADERALQISYNLPVDANGWRWGDYIRASRTIIRDVNFENVYSIASDGEKKNELSRKQSVYPFASIDNSFSGLSIAVPMDVPRIYRIEYNLSRGYSIQYDFGLSQQTEKLGKGHANFTFIIYKIDEPEWGFRSVSKKYYEIYPRFFVKRNIREGTLNWRPGWVSSEPKNVSDFGLIFDSAHEFAFNEGNSRQLFDLNNGIFPLQYIEPWGIWRAFPGDTEEPIHLEKIESLKSDLNSTTPWNGQDSEVLSSKEIAQAIFNSAPLDINGKMYFVIGLWNKESWQVPMQNYPTNPDPDIPSPNIYDITYTKFQMASNKGIELGGISVDSVGASFLWHPVENYRTPINPQTDIPEGYLSDHYKYADIPLVFSYSSRKPVMLELFSNYEYFVKLRQKIVADNKLIHANIFPDSYNFFAHFIDILGGETGTVEPSILDSWDSNDITSSYRRTLSYQKTNVNIYTAFWKYWPERSETENYIKHSTFYAIYPGSSSGNFFIEANRDLFKKYIPIIRNISKAGWEPIPYATIDNQNIMLERYGHWNQNNLHYTVRNKADTIQNGTIVIDLSRLGAASAVSIQIKELVSSDIINPRTIGTKMMFDISVDPHDTLVFKIYTN